ncbi:MAG: hypothetical protein FJ267_04495 [Planctomycetes bacterium]|nr:hypothetical protein [Planctomycetota bacterium]
MSRSNFPDDSSNGTGVQFVRESPIDVIAFLSHSSILGNVVVVNSDESLESAEANDVDNAHDSVADVAKKGQTHFRIGMGRPIENEEYDHTKPAVANCETPVISSLELLRVRTRVRGNSYVFTGRRIADM